MQNQAKVQPEKPSTPQLTEALPIAQRKALVVEDDQWIVPLIECALEEAVPGIHMDWVESVDEAIQKTKESNYEVIVADIFLKGEETGLQFWDHCKKSCAESKILLTSVMPIDFFLNKVAGDRHNPLYLPKPFSIERLKSTVYALLDYTGVSS